MADPGHVMKHWFRAITRKSRRTGRPHSQVTDSASGQRRSPCGRSETPLTDVAAARTPSRAGFPAPFGVLLLATIGWGIGFLLVVTEGNPLGGKSLIDPPEFLVFAFFTVAQTTLWAVAAWPLLATLRRLRPHLSGNYLWIRASALILAIAVFSPLLFPPIEGTPPAHRTRVLILHTVGGLLGLLGITGMWLIDAAARTLGRHTDNLEIADFQFLRGDLTRLRTILAAVVGIVTLAAGVYRYALIASGVVPEGRFPIALVLAMVPSSRCYWPSSSCLLT
jgi:hypothetical protein